MGSVINVLGKEEPIITADSTNYTITFNPNYNVQVSNGSNQGFIVPAYQTYYNQNLNVQTNSTTTNETISTISFTSQYTGYALIRAFVRSSNNTAGDGVQISLYNGSTLLDSYTITQGTADVPNTFVLSYLLPVVSGRTYNINLGHNAVTGGAISTQIMEFSVQPSI